MARLPEPGGDAGNWGEILNEFLRQEHNDDGTLRASASLATKTDNAITENLVARVGVEHHSDGSFRNAARPADIPNLSATLVAASDAPPAVKNIATYVCSGTDDHTTIMDALAIGRPLQLSEGTFALGRNDAGPYAIHPPDGAIIRGRGIGTTILTLAADVPDATTVIQSASGARNVEIAFLSIDGNKTARGATVQQENEGINLKQPTNCSIHHVYVHDCGQDGIDLDDATSCKISDSTIENCGGAGVHIGGEFGPARRYSTVVNVTSINNGHARRAWSGNEMYGNGLNASGSYVQFIGCTSINDAVGISLYGASYVSVVGCVVVDPGQDGVGAPGITVHGGGSNLIVAHNIIYNRASITGAHGIHVGEYGAANRVRVTGNIAVACNSAVIVTSGDSIDITDNTIHACSSGVRMAAVSTDGRWSVQNNRISQTAYGVYVATGDGRVSNNIITGASIRSIDVRGPISNVTVKDNDVLVGANIRLLNSGGAPSDCVITENVLGSGITIDVSGAGHTIRRNTGYTTEARGTSTITDTNDYVDVTHGMATTPTSVVVSPRGEEFVWVSARTDTTLTVSRTGTSGSLAFDWYAEV